MGVFACGWLGFVFTCGVCLLVVFALLGVGALVGWWGSVVLPLIMLTVLWWVGFWCSRLWCGLVGVCDVPLGVG